MKNALWIALAVVILIFLGIWLWAANDKDDSALGLDDQEMMDDMDDNTNGSNSDGNTNGNGGSTAGEQINYIRLKESSGGSVVTVDTATLTDPGYIVVYKVDITGEVDMIGRSELLEATDYYDYDVNTNVSLATNDSVIAVLFKDNGDGEFSTDNGDVFLRNNNTMVSDIDVVGVAPSGEQDNLLEQAEDVLEQEMGEQS